jgi:hypothetical protein
MQTEILADRLLSLRLERAEALTNASFVEARARLQPESRAKWISIAGAMAMFDGVDSPCTQTFGLGLLQLPSVEEITAIEDFFKARGAAVLHEVSPHADKALIPMLCERGYRPLELSNVLYLPLALRTAPTLPSATQPAGENESLHVRIPSPDESEKWARTSADGWSTSAEFADLIFEMGRVAATAQGNTPFLAELNGEPIAAGALSIREGVALFAGASTLPAWRRRGAQQALLETRFQYSMQMHCDLAMMVAEPGSSSQRNAERQGFRVAYTRTKWLLAGPAAVKASVDLK